MRFLSLFSGIEAASVAWGPLGWKAAAVAEIEPFPCAVLAHHYPDVPNLGDVTKFKEWPDLGTVDVVCGGSPCQDVSIGVSAGTGKTGLGLDGERSGLAFSFTGIVDRYQPEWFVWENVPNTLSARHSAGFLRFLSEVGESGYFCAWRVMDQREFGPFDQSRPRIVVVGNRSDPRRAAAVLLEPEGISRNSQARQEAAPVLTARGAMAFDDRTPCVLDINGARITTPLEWERSLGFPDNYTLVRYRGKLAADGPRYKALGNSWAVNVFRWVGHRIEMVEDIAREIAS